MQIILIAYDRSAYNLSRLALFVCLFECALVHLSVLSGLSKYSMCNKYMDGRYLYIHISVYVCISISCAQLQLVYYQYADF